MRILAGLVILTYSGWAVADAYHYKDILIGERAASMGGAYIAVSDDPSGIWYNPAGILFSNENYFSLSANAYNASETKFKSIVSGRDYTYKSEGLIPTFLGFTQSFGKSKWGFAVVASKYDLMDQDDMIDKISTTNNQPSSFRRKFFNQDTQYNFGPAFSTEVANNLVLGVSLFAFYRSEKVIDQQWIQKNPEPSGNYEFTNYSLSRTYMGVIPKIGLQYMPKPKWSTGLTISQPVNLGGKGNSRKWVSKTDSKNGQFSNDVTFTENNDVYHEVPVPLEVGLGTAYFFSQTFLLAADFNYYTEDSAYKDFKVVATYNWSLGAEYYPSQSTAYRLGLYSNNANTPSVADGSKNQPTHVDLIGLSTGVSFYRPGSSLTLGVAYSMGSGKGQGLGNVTDIQTVEQSSATFFLTGSYQL